MITVYACTCMLTVRQRQQPRGVARKFLMKIVNLQEIFWYLSGMRFMSNQTLRFKTIKRNRR